MPCRLLLTIILLLLFPVSVSAQFDTVINVPPDVSPNGIGSNQQLNLFDSGSIPDFFDAGATDGSSTNVEVNISGGTVGWGFDANAGSTVNIFGGTFGQSFDANADSTVNISGGRFDFAFGANAGSTVNVYGEEFQLDGQFLKGLDEVGDQVRVNVPRGSVLAGLFEDGNVFAFGLLFNADFFFPGTLTLIRADAPLAPATIDVPFNEAPFGLRDAQVLNLRDGGELPSRFTTLAGSVVNITGGTAGAYFVANSGSAVNISGGDVGIRFTSNGARVIISGGTVGSDFAARGDSTIEISGGTVGPNFEAHNFSTVNISGGSVGENMFVAALSTVNISGGMIGGHFTAFSHSTVNISGGSIGSNFDARFDSTVMISGAEFQIDGQLISGLDQVGDEIQLDVSGSSIFAGVLTDGTIFKFGEFQGDSFASGTLTLVRAQAPLVPAIVSVPFDPSPAGLRGGQTLNLQDGGELPDGFSTLSGSVVNVMGGMVGPDFFAGSGSTVSISGGTVDRGFRAHDGSTVNISAGTVSRNFFAYGGSTIDISGGTVGRFFEANSGSTVNISGGQIESDFEARAGSTVNISGGQIGRDFQARAGSTVKISGAEFQIDGQLVSGLDQAGDEIQLNVSGSSIFMGVLTDGTIFKFGDFQGDSFVSGTLTLVRADAPTVAPIVNIPSDPIPAGLRGGQTLNLQDGGELPNGFNTLADSVVNVMGGTVGTLFTANGGTINISGGTVGYGFVADRNSTVNISGGAVGGSFEAKAGSTVEISGGTVGRNFAASFGSAINISGVEFQINGQLLTQLQDTDDSVQVNLSSGSVLAGVLADGTVFDFGSFKDDSFSLRTLTLTLAYEGLPSSSVLNVPFDAAPPHLRSGQTLNLLAGSQLPRDFMALAGSVVNILDGSVGKNFHANGSTVNLIEGSLGGGFQANHSTVNISGGTVGYGFNANNGSTVNIFGGRVSDGFNANSGSTVNISGGEHDFEESGFLLSSGATLTIAGGTIYGRFSVPGGASLNISGGSVSDIIIANSGASVNVSGGAVDGFVRADSDATVNVFGEEFEIDGQLISALVQVGEQVQINIPSGAVLAGVLADGTVFKGGSFADGTLTLLRTNAPPAPQVVNVPADPMPPGLRRGQVLNLHAGSELRGMYNTFNTLAGSVVNVLGGTVTNHFDADSGLTVNIVEGNVGFGFNANSGSTVNITGGSVGASFDANNGSTVTISGGSVGDRFDAGSGSTVNITGGTVGGSFRARGGSVVNILGGSIGSSFTANENSNVAIFGTEFLLDGIPIDDLASVGDSVVLEYRGSAELSVTLRDGRQRVFALYDDSQSGNPDRFDRDATLQLAFSTPWIPGDVNLDDTVDRADIAVFARLLGRSGPGGWETGDFDLDDSTSLLDLARLRRNLGQSVVSPSPVPEPGGLVLVLTALLALVAEKRRNRSRHRSCSKGHFAKHLPVPKTRWPIVELLTR